MAKVTKLTLLNMRIILLSMFFGMFLASNGQIMEMGQFKASDRAIIWQKVYDCHGDARAVAKKIITTGPFTDVDTVAMTCKIADFRCNYKKYGCSYMSTPFYLSQGNFFATVKIESTDGKYRVTLTHIQVLANIIHSQT